MEQQSTPIKENQEDANLRQLFEQYAYYWKWFALTIILSVGIALVYLRYAQRTYSTTAKILLKDERSAAAGELAGIAELTSSMGLGGTRSAFVTDQIEVLSSRRLMRKVVERHNLNIIYSVKGKVRTAEVLGNDVPFSVQTQELNGNSPISLRVVFQGNAQLHITDLGSNKDVVTGFDLPVKIENTNLIFRRNSNSKLGVNEEFVVKIIPKDWAVDAALGAVSITPNKETQSYIVNFAMASTITKKAELILNSLIDIYNLDLTEDKMRTTRATSDFINKRRL
jgi:uncharacterized protein involved in exopolysaccharide biosynthesis